MHGIFTKPLGRFCARFWKNQRGATAIEYGFIVVLISLGAIAALGAVGDSLSNVFSSFASDVEDATPGDNGGGNAPSVG